MVDAVFPHEIGATCIGGNANLVTRLPQSPRKSNQGTDVAFRPDGEYDDPHELAFPYAVMAFSE
jgi:hypothetical protein